MRELPVEDGADALGVEQHVSDAIIAVDEGMARCRGGAIREPAEGQLDDRVRLGGESAIELLIAFDLVRGATASVGRRGKELEPMPSTSTAWMRARIAPS
jgi:hypothetical protein